ncbi:glycosyltransferase family 2 protein [Demequina sp. NBRC 110051]|uniref:glycosyltransferase family 2 protein n=1 Tax=Demequina sp. NBRC 110051 TaxID=1570340 RepID=UPI0009FE247B|nr:glycosyltransferase family 2 protein [Demequina sp. NBRC 110051]
MTRPDITVIVPVLNGEDVLGVTLESLVRQQESVPRLQVIGINDGSTDRTGDVFAHYAKRIDDLTVITHDEPAGLASARNRGLEAAEGDRLVFLDGDDWLAPGRLSTLAGHLDTLGCDFVRTDHLIARGRSRVRHTVPFFPRGEVRSPRTAIGPHDHATMVDYPYAWAGMFTRRMLERGLLHFHEGLATAEDRPWIWRLHLQADTFAVVDAPPLFYRRGSATSLTQILDARQLDFLRAFDLARDVVEADHEAPLWRSKFVRQMSAIAAHHLGRASRMARPLRRELDTGVRALFASVDPEVLAQQWTEFSPSRRDRLRKHVPAEIRRSVKR